ncbi:MAG TPA: hypothetical protein VFG11_07500, partial [Acidobacteriota bacterium]|nr:hypothetical protein [Acidobacteriota bacterium]
MVTNHPQFTLHQKRKFFQDGYIKVAGVIPQKLINMALRSINYSVGMGIDPKKIETFRANSFCPELRRSQAILDLLDQTSLWSLAQSLTEAGKLKLYAEPQIALRFPIMAVPAD